jgi:hypothetical protein
MIYIFSSCPKVNNADSLFRVCLLQLVKFFFLEMEAASSVVWIWSDQVCVFLVGVLVEMFAGHF